MNTLQKRKREAVSRSIDSSAIIDPLAEIADGVEVGPFTIIGPHVRIERGVKIENHVTILGRVTIGEDCNLFPHSVIGAFVPTQAIEYRKRTRIEDVTQSRPLVCIGARTTIREGSILERSSDEDHPTTIGDECLVMSGCHVDQGARVGNRAILTNGTHIGRFAVLEECVQVSGAVQIAPEIILGAFSFVGALARLERSLPPFLLAEGNPATARCVNTVGMRRNGFSVEQIRAVGEAFRQVYRMDQSTDQARESLRAAKVMGPAVHRFLDFVDFRMKISPYGQEKRRAA